MEGTLKSDAWEDKTTGQKRTKVGVRALRIQQLDWDERGDSAPKPKPRPIEEPLPEDDIPF